MKRLLLFLSCCLMTLANKAQTPSSVDFNTANAAGQMFYYHITDAANRYVEVTHPDIYSSLYQFAGKEVKLPSTVLNSNNGLSYTVLGIGTKAFKYAEAATLILPETLKYLDNYSFDHSRVDSIYLPNGLEEIRQGAFQFSDGTKHLKLPPTIRVLGVACFNQMADLEWIYGLKELHLQTIPAFFCRANYKLKMPFDFLQDVKSVGRFAFEGCTPHSIILPETIERIETNAFVAENFDEITIKATTPPTLEDLYSFLNWGTPQTFYLPIDATAAYKSAEYWKDITGKFCEQTVIGATGYTTFYLENENFKVPDGCTAYIITGVTPSGNIATPDNAIVKAFGAGKIIPKQTGFILQGTPNSTVVYQANVTGIEEDVTGNLLVGTATEREISGAGYKYYVLSNSGDQGLGFYKQGTRGGASIKLKAHRAGLRLNESIARAKSFFIDFDAARENANVAGIRNIGQEAEGRDNVIYDLQGRRVKNPTHGIYIINGKKVIK